MFINSKERNEYDNNNINNINNPQKRELEEKKYDDVKRRTYPYAEDTIGKIMDLGNKQIVQVKFYFILFFNS